MPERPKPDRSNAYRLGRLLAWLALVCVLLAPVTGTARMLAMASLDNGSICRAEPAPDHPAGDQDRMADCAGLCVLCAPMLALPATSAPLPHPAACPRLATVVPPAPPAPPALPRSDSYPRGPPLPI